MILLFLLLLVSIILTGVLFAGATGGALVVLLVSGDLIVFIMIVKCIVKLFKKKN